MIDKPYYSLEEAAQLLGVQKPSLYYYIRTLQLQAQKFPLDRKKYLSRADFERIKVLKDEARERGGTEPEKEVA